MNAPEKRKLRTAGKILGIGAIVLVAAVVLANFVQQNPGLLHQASDAAPGQNQSPVASVLNRIAQQVDPNALSKPLLEKLVNGAIDSSDQTWCMNVFKIKSAATNEIVTLNDSSDAPAANDNQNGTDPQNASPSPSDPFPLIFAEEAYIRWSDQDAFVMGMLIAGNYIAVHSGGYPQSQVEPGTPGDAYAPHNLQDVEAVIAAIRERGAVVDLTNAGRNGGVWNSSTGLCVVGNWTLESIDAWTPEATDSKGNIVTHIKARVVLAPARIGDASKDINPMGIVFRPAQDWEFTAVKYNDGWHLVQPSGDQQPTASASQASSGTQDDGESLAGAFALHSALSGNHDDENDENSDSSESSGDGPED